MACTIFQVFGINSTGYRTPTYRLKKRAFYHWATETVGNTCSHINTLKIYIYLSLNLDCMLDFDSVTPSCSFLGHKGCLFSFIGPLLQVGGSECQNNRRRSFSTLTLKSHDRKDSVRQCFLFSRCLLVTSRTSNGKLQIVPVSL